MGNANRPENSRSFSDDLITHRSTQQRPHASSDALPYRPRGPPQKNNYNNNNNNNINNKNANNNKPKPIIPIFASKKNHYNPINGMKSKSYQPGIQSPTKTHPNMEQNKSESLSIIQAEHSITNSNHPKVLIIEGWLTKRGENSKKLKKRYWKLYDNGKLSYNTKQTGSFKKYANLKVGIDDMSLAEDTGFNVQVSGRHLTFYAETTNERDAWFAIIYKYYYQKGQEQVILLAASSGDRDKDEAKDKFDLPKLEIITEKYKKKNRKSRRKKRRSSFDSTKAAVAIAQQKQRAQKKTKANASTPPPTHNNHSHQEYMKQRSRSSTRRNGRNGRNGNTSKEDGMVIFSEQYMHQICDGKTCLSLERVHYVLKKYDLWRNKEHKIMSLGMYKYINNGLGEFYDNTHLLNDYNHLIAYHENVFNHIYEYFDGECEIGKCLLIKRLHRDRNYYKNDMKRKQIYFNYEDPKEINTQQILDKIHCFYRHSYDLGLKVKKSKLLSIANNARSNHRKWRTSVINSMHKQSSLTNEESKEAHMIIMQNDTTTDNEEEEEESTDMKGDNDDDYDDMDDEETHGFEDEWKLLEICGLIQQKRNHLRDLRGSQRMDSNKFISTVGKSRRYHYWKKYDDDDDRNWQINMKYEDFKQEMLSNKLYFISLKQWAYLTEKANDHFTMRRSKKIRPHKYWAELYNLPNLSITKSHLIAIILYCNFDILNRIFAETFYKQKKKTIATNQDEKELELELDLEESDIELKNRHSNFYHFGRLLRELIECFGKKIYNKNIVFYHGIMEDMMFIETSVYFYAPLSTTTCIEVAIAYGENSYLLELMDDDTVLGMARYFDCCWLSDFSGEYEKYFLGGYKPLKIHTILDAVLGRNYINYLKAISIIDEMMQGYYFYTESDEIKHIILHLLQTQIANHKKKMSKPNVLNSELLKEIRALNKPKPKLYLGILSDDTEQDDFDIKQITEMKNQNQNEIEIESHRRRISRKISEQFTSLNLHLRDKQSSTTIDMAMEEYDYFNETPIYITNLVNYYCENVITVCIDWKNMNDSHLKGFKCCKKLLCVSDDVIKYEWIKLNTFLTLFPNLKALNVRNIKLSQFTIKDIHKFLSKAKENNKYNDLYRIEIFEVDQNEYPISQCLKQYLDKFKEVGWTITFNPFEDEMCILKI